MSDDVIILNQGLESRTSKTGRQRYTITVKAEPLVINMDPKTLGATAAQAIVTFFKQSIRNISASAAPNTIRARETAARNAGKPWVQRRYAGGRIGSMPPNAHGNTAFNDSGRFASSITANASSDGAWRINVAANRMQDATSGGVLRIWTRLVQLVPEFGDPRKLMSNDFMKRAIKMAASDAIKKAHARTSELRIEAAKALFDRARQFLDVIAG
jgi:hypothetical protein